MALAIAIRNIPEGLAVGVAGGAMLYAAVAELYRHLRRGACRTFGFITGVPLML